MSSADDGGRRAGRDEHTEPLVEHQARHARLLERRHVGQAWRASLGRLRQQAQGAGLVVRDQRRRTERAELDVAADQVVDRLPAAAIRHLLHADAGDLARTTGSPCAAPS